MTLRPTSTLCNAEQSLLVIVDIQKRLAAAMSEASRAQVIQSAATLTQTAGLLDIPLLVTEQYPQGLGTIEEEVAWHFPKEITVLEKSTFSAMGLDAFRQQLHHHQRSQIILSGMESHVCVLQTAMELRQEGYEVFVVEDGICSRNPANHANALRRMRSSGIAITNLESVLFEWLKAYRHDHFKQVLSMIR